MWYYGHGKSMQYIKLKTVALNYPWEWRGVGPDVRKHEDTLVPIQCGEMIMTAQQNPFSAAIFLLLLLQSTNSNLSFFKNRNMMRPSTQGI